jgi:predicted RNA-binding Zn ribbon-like protein
VASTIDRLAGRSRPVASGGPAGVATAGVGTAGVGTAGVGTAGAVDPALVTTKDLRRAGFPFRSSALCLDFVATLAKRGMGDRELLAGPDELATWLRAAELPASTGPVTHADVAGIRALRAAVHDLTRAHVDRCPLPVAAIELVNTAARPGPPAALLDLDGRTLLAPEPAPLEAVMAIVARDAIDLFTGHFRDRIRACIGHDCSLFFVDRSRPGSRRWCAMAACGEKASSATYRRRHPGSPRPPRD